MKIPKIIATDKTSVGTSYHIDFGNNMLLWFDVWEDEGGEITGDWNKYIFFADDEQDMKEKDFQEANNDEVGAYNFADALSLCREQYEIDKENAAK